MSIGRRLLFMAAAAFNSQTPSTMSRKRFKYLGILFEDMQQDVTTGYTLTEITNRVSSDRELGMSRYSWGKLPYSHEDFYKAAGQSTSDLFKCVKTGRIYMPGQNELFLYE